MRADPRLWTTPLVLVLCAGALTCGIPTATDGRPHLAQNRRGFDPGQFPEDQLAKPQETKPPPVQPACTEQVSLPSASADGLPEVGIVNPCRKDQAVAIGGDNLIYDLQFDSTGAVKAQIPIFHDAGLITWQQPDGSQKGQSIAFTGIRDAFKIALIWSGKIELSLHVLEPSALFQGPNMIDVHRDALSGKLIAGNGRIEFASRSAGRGVNVDLYGLPARRNPHHGILPFEVEFVSRGLRATPPYCGSGEFAAPAFDIWVLRYGKLEKRTNSRFGAAACGAPSPANLRGDASLNP